MQSSNPPWSFPALALFARLLDRQLPGQQLLVAVFHGGDLLSCEEIERQRDCLSQLHRQLSPFELEFLSLGLDVVFAAAVGHRLGHLFLSGFFAEPSLARARRHMPGSCRQH